MRAQILAAIDSGKWAQNVAAVSLASWKNSMLTTGLTNIANGARNAIPKVQSFMQSFLPYVSQVQQTVKAMPNVTQADRENRMIQNMRLMSQYKKPPGT
jgi:ribose 1,5-bisphosphokinase PhnN